jgi:hypothetical protein
LSLHIVKKELIPRIRRRERYLRLKTTARVKPATYAITENLNAPSSQPEVTKLDPRREWDVGNVGVLPLWSFKA